MAGKKKVGWKNQVRATLPPKYLCLVNRYAELNDIPNSQAIKQMIRSFFDNMPAELKSKITSSIN